MISRRPDRFTERCGKTKREIETAKARGAIPGPFCLCAKIWKPRIIPVAMKRGIAYR